LGVTRSYVYYKVKPTRRNSWIMLCFLGVAGLAAAITWQGPLSLLPMLGTMSGGVAYWQTKPKHIHRLALIASPLGFIYNTISGSYAGMVIETINFTSNLIGQYRFDMPKARRYRKTLRIARPA
jgi:hypothetical protein